MRVRDTGGDVGRDRRLERAHRCTLWCVQAAFYAAGSVSDGAHCVPHTRPDAGDSTATRSLIRDTTRSHAVRCLCTAHFYKSTAKGAPSPTTIDTLPEDYQLRSLVRATWSKSK